MISLVVRMLILSAIVLLGCSEVIRGVFTSLMVFRVWWFVCCGMVGFYISFLSCLPVGLYCILLASRWLLIYYLFYCITLAFNILSLFTYKNKIKINTLKRIRFKHKTTHAKHLNETTRLTT